MRQTFNEFPGLQAVLIFRESLTNMILTLSETEYVKTIKDHLAYLCGGADIKATFKDKTEVAALDYLLDWLASSIQTGKKPNILLVLTGDPGCGKSIFVEQLMNKIYGDHAHQVMQPSAIKTTNSDYIKDVHQPERSI